MTDAEALKLAIEACEWPASREPLNTRWMEAAAMLERLAPFVAVALKWGRWYSENFPTEDNWSQEEGDLIRAYRALSTEETTKP